MKIKLIDVESEPQEVTFGTCELCMSTGFANEPIFTFLINGIEVEVNGYEWSWGDYDEVPDVNVIDFAAWLNKIDFPKGTDVNFYFLQRLIWAFKDGTTPEDFEALMNQKGENDD